MPSRRQEIAMTPEEQREFLEQGWTLQVASIGPKGFPHLVAMWYVVIDGKIHFTTYGKSQKVMNLRRNPKMAVMLESGKLYHELKGLVIEGTATIIEDTAFTAEVMARVANKYQGLPIPLEATEDRLRAASKRVTIRVEPVDVYSWDHSKLGGRY
ncbi:MAG: pyridoxamine 5'-phosphate oxidase family protein [Chloroflexota bacterium]|nr:pyridoxamine 5'-phosphate oxidase family protein [Dehalococcoidia bacterium]MDW8046385.1 pyridoxamine 5'-phosphate oxidase family protein [Chloroflexota bacterium]